MDQITQFGKYQLLERIAVGGMAELFLGKMTGDQGFEKLVALKCILPQFCAQPEVVESFIDEAKLAAFLQHENIVQIYDFGCMGNRYFMAMEYLVGKDLRQILDGCRQNGVPLPLEHSLYVVSRICAGLDYAHNLTDYRGQGLQIVHRDINPQNVFICYSGMVKILDFGIAKAAGRSSCTQSGVIKGKAAYMSPEQATGKPVDRRSDIFALGILLYELASGKRMFQGNPLEILEQVRTARYLPAAVSAPGLPSGLYEVMDRALARNPEDRYPDCGKMLSDLEDCIHALPNRSDTRQLGQFLRSQFPEAIGGEDRAVSKMPHQTSAISDTEAPVPLMSDGVPGEAGHTVTMVSSGAVEAGHRRSGFRYLPVVAVCLAIGIGLFTVVSKRFPGYSGDDSPSAYAIRGTVEDITPAEDPGQTRSEPQESGGDHERTSISLVLEQASELLESNPSAAVDVLKQGLLMAPDDRQLLFNLGYAYVRMETYPQAIEVFSQVVDNHPSLHNAVFNLAYAYAESGQLPEAESRYLQVVEMAPPYLDEALYNLAMVQEKLGKRELAIRQLALAVEVNPNNLQAVNYLRRLRGEKQRAPQ
jgi:serine/threonine protein kinase